MSVGRSRLQPRFSLSSSSEWGTSTCASCRGGTKRESTRGLQQMLVNLLLCLPPYPSNSADSESAPCCVPPGNEEATESSSLLLPVGVKGSFPSGKRGHAGKALFYGAQVFYSFFIMLLFMTYNGWVMIAVAVGAALGYVMWGGTGTSAKSVACH